MTAQVVTITEGYSAQYLPLKKVKWAWTTDSSNGAIVDSTTGTEVNKTTAKYSGIIFSFITDPDATAPTDNYDVTILDDDGYDVLRGAGADRDTSTTEYLAASSINGCVLDSQLRLNIANAGNSKKGLVILYII